MSIVKEYFGSLNDGQTASIFTLSNDDIRIQVTNYGAKIVSAYVPDRYGKLGNVILGYSTFEHYLKGHPYLGATIGRVTNRIGNAQFELNGITYKLSKNIGRHHLHGGTIGFDSVLWDIVNYHDDEIPWVEFKLDSLDGDEGYPGKINVTVRYTLLKDNTLNIDFVVTTDKSTIVNLTNHAYFNLAAESSDNILNHSATFFSSRYLKADRDSVPTGEIVDVDNSPLDFRIQKEIGKDIFTMSEPILTTGGYDQFFVSDNYEAGESNIMAEVYEPTSGRVLQVFSTLPGMQFYTSNFFDSILPLANGKIYGKHSAFCIEPSYFPDAPNHLNFKSISLEPSETYRESISFKFLNK